MSGVALRRPLLFGFALGAIVGGGVAVGVLGVRGPATEGDGRRDEPRSSDSGPVERPSELRGASRSPKPLAAAKEADTSTTVSLDLADWFCQDLSAGNRTQLDEFWKGRVLDWFKSGHIERILRAIDVAIARRTTAGQLERRIDVIGSLQAEAAIVAALRMRHPDVAWTPGYAEALALEIDGSEGPWNAVVATLANAPLDGGGVRVEDMVIALAEKDPERTDRELSALANARGWSSDFLDRVARAFAKVNRAVIADAWSVRARSAPRSPESVAKEHGQLESGLANARTNLAADPTATSTWKEIGRCLDQLGRKGEAFDAWTRVIEIDPIEHEALESLIALDPERAAPIVERSLAGAHDDASSLLLASARLLLGESREAADALFKSGLDVGSERAEMAELVPDVALQSLAPYRRNRHVDPSTRIVAARALAAIGRVDEAVAELETAIAEGSEEAFPDLATIRPDDALKAIGEATKERTSYLTEAARGDALLRLGRKDEARAAFDVAARLAQGSIVREAEGGSRVARIGRVMLDPERELPKVVAAAHDRPDDSDAWGFLGDVYRRLGKKAEARDAYDHAFRSDTEQRIWLIRRNLCR